jgi:hypothetical protein
MRCFHADVVWVWIFMRTGLLPTYLSQVRCITQASRGVRQSLYVTTAYYFKYTLATSSQHTVITNLRHNVTPAGDAVIQKNRMNK